MFGRIKYQINFTAFILAGIGVIFAGSAATTARAQVSAAEYAGLSGKRKTLFDDWARRENQRDGATLTPVQRYGKLSPSQRTTFEAITHALSRTNLSDGSGRTRAAIDMVANLNSIAGQEPGKSGDEEFRLYFKMMPNAVQILESSREFHRGKDNHFYHSGYPINIRQEGEPPTLQFSITRDEQIADVDVDYRSSHFPAALFNGHLTAANSDVRPPPNYRTHISRWRGLINWWGNNFSELILPQFEPSFVHAKYTRADFPLPFYSPQDDTEARAIAAKVDEFLDAWLVKRDVNAAMKFASAKAAVCVNVDEDSAAERLSGKRSLSVFRNALTETVRALGTPRVLGDAIKAVEPHDTGLKIVDHKEKTAYALASATGGHYEHFICNAAASPTTAAVNREQVYGTHYLSAFRLRLPNNTDGGGMILVWEKQDNRWKLVSFDILSH